MLTEADASALVTFVHAVDQLTERGLCLGWMVRSGMIRQIMGAGVYGYTVRAILPRNVAETKVIEAEGPTLAAAVEALHRELLAAGLQGLG